MDEERIRQIVNEQIWRILHADKEELPPLESGDDLARSDIERNEELREG
jgi:hypothetical protein